MWFFNYFYGVGVLLVYNIVLSIFIHWFITISLILILFHDLFFIVSVVVCVRVFCCCFSFSNWIYYYGYYILYCVYAYYAYYAYYPYFTYYPRYTILIYFTHDTYYPALLMLYGFRSLIRRWFGDFF